KKDGVSLGNKTHYQHHGGWFARNGYVCLVIDTLQLGEIEGIHHGTYRYNRWWWNARGYTSAGVEAWNCIRALDYLQSRPEVDGTRLAVTGRSGGGAYSWWIAALDERIQCAVPVAGITSLHNHVIDGCVEGHCDCMFMVNTFRWDYPTVAALVAPRPLLISNTDKDSIFPLEGVVDIHKQVRHIYELYGRGNQLGLQITEGPHKDTQELRVHAFRWINRFLRKTDELVTTTAVPLFEQADLRVFETLPADERNTSIDETFTLMAAGSIGPDDPEQARHVLREMSFRAWPDNDASWQPPTDMRSEQLPFRMQQPGLSLEMTRLHFSSQNHVPLFVDVVHASGTTPRDWKTVRLVAGDESLWEETQKFSAGEPLDQPLSPEIRAWLEETKTVGTVIAFFFPRGTGPQAWNGDEKKQIQIQRRFQLLGMTPDGMRTWDIRRAVQVLRQTVPESSHLTLTSHGNNGLLVLLASLFEPTVSKVDVSSLPDDRGMQPVILNFSRFATAETIQRLVTGQ
ncbi:MAG: prolyl oligopeptidase family serine peptidase, partial [Planctomycetaceae bacterium]|nr:prolyl oligopeptidase family serine peptidase [Planctomycetaceae bacterium]